jgi:hypothetical protein
MQFKNVKVGQKFYFRDQLWEKVSNPGDRAQLGCAERRTAEGKDLGGPIVGFYASTSVRLFREKLERN